MKTIKFAQPNISNLELKVKKTLKLLGLLEVRRFEFEKKLKKI